jgi:hypothetical protein
MLCRNEEVKIRIHLKVSIMNVVERTKSPTQVFRVLSLALLALSGSVIAAPVVLPTVVVSVADIWLVGGVTFCSESNDS